MVFEKGGMKSVPPRRSGWVLRLENADIGLRIECDWRVVVNLQSDIRIPQSDEPPLPRGGTDLIAHSLTTVNLDYRILRLFANLKKTVKTF
jgi:hypothetical protein